jgi:uncharacterized protein YecE (DUF72 family)
MFTLHEMRRACACMFVFTCGCVCTPAHITQHRSDCKMACMPCASPNISTALVGCAGWSIGGALAPWFSAAGSQLQRYSRVLGAVEINSSFYRSHRPSTYARWAASVPEDFRFCVKVPKLITHQLRLCGVEAALAQFAGEALALGEKLGCVLVQLPPSAVLDAGLAKLFFDQARQHFSCMLACEARHPSWFGTEATALLQARGVTRVQADPPKGETTPFVATTDASYRRLHGSPKVYYSAYSEDYRADLRKQLMRETQPAWVTFDNSASGAALQNAVSLVKDPW